MAYTTLISVDDLAPHVNEAGWRVVDCRFSLNEPERGLKAYMADHIPGAVYAHLDDDLSSCIVPGQTGRHPLPKPANFAQKIGEWGIDAATQVVAYDDFGGAIAARLWWMLRWIGHEAVAVLDGGWPAWKAAGRGTESGFQVHPVVRYKASPQSKYGVDAETVERIRTDPAYRLIDARAAERYRGEHEPIDPVAGHIPGAHSAPFKENLDADGFFRSPEALRDRFEAVAGPTPADHIICYCGSGVTAAHNILAMEYAGLTGARMYPGSWSEWITDTERPLATGPH